MEDKVLVKALIPASLKVSLDREARYCGCPISAIVSRALVHEIRLMRAQRRNDAHVLAGQLELAKAED